MGKFLSDSEVRKYQECIEQLERENAQMKAVIAEQDEMIENLAFALKEFYFNAAGDNTEDIADEVLAGYHSWKEKQL